MLAEVERQRLVNLDIFRNITEHDDSDIAVCIINRTGKSRILGLTDLCSACLLCGLPRICRILRIFVRYANGDIASSMDAASILANNRLFFPVFIMKIPPSVAIDYYEEAASGNRLPCGKVFRLGPWLCETGFHRSCPCLYNLLFNE